MKEIDRRALTRGFLCGVAIACAGLRVSSQTANAMPLDDRIPGSLDDWIEKTQVWVAPGPRRGWRRRRVWVAGGVEAAAFAVGSGCDQTQGHCKASAYRPRPWWLAAILP